MTAPKRRWMMAAGSLTRRLQAANRDQFRVQLLHQGWGQPRKSEARLLNLASRQRVMIREVLLSGNRKPWIFARTVIPATSLAGRLRRLARLGEKPLGRLLFGDSRVRRSPFQLALLPLQSYRLPVRLVETGPQTLLWARRSVFTCHGHPLLVNEVFLPAFHPWEKSRSRSSGDASAGRASASGSLTALPANHQPDNHRSAESANMAPAMTEHRDPHPPGRAVQQSGAASLVAGEALASHGQAGPGNLRT